MTSEHVGLIFERREPTRPAPSLNWPFLYSAVPGRGIVRNLGPGSHQEAPRVPRARVRLRFPLEEPSEGS